MRYLLLIAAMLTVANLPARAQDTETETLQAELATLTNRHSSLKAELDRVAKRIAEVQMAIARLRFSSTAGAGVAVVTTRDVKMTTEPGYGEEVGQIPASTPVVVGDVDGSYIRVIYGDRVGWISDVFIERSQELERLKAVRSDDRDRAKAAEDAQERRSAVQAEQARRQAFVNANPSIPSRLKEAIMEGSVVISMTAEMVRLVWGEPGDINRTAGSWGVHEQWVYGSRYIYFENGTVTSWQD